MPTMKNCSICKEVKQDDQFYPRMARCKTCHNTKVREWAANNPEKVKIARNKWRSDPENRKKENAASRRWNHNNMDHRKLVRRKKDITKYGLTYEQYLTMKEAQNDCCAICKKPSYRDLDIDHNHKTGKVRQLLCSNHNTLIGLCNESTEILEAIINYLNKHNPNQQQPVVNDEESTLSPDL